MEDAGKIFTVWPCCDGGMTCQEYKRYTDMARRASSAPPPMDKTVTTTHNRCGKKLTCSFVAGKLQLEVIT